MNERTKPTEGSATPWGPAQIVDEPIAGVVCVSTASHGGVWLSEERLEQMPADARSADGWYEEDCEAAFVVRQFPQAFEKGAEIEAWVKAVTVLSLAHYAIRGAA